MLKQLTGNPVAYVTIGVIKILLATGDRYGHVCPCRVNQASQFSPLVHALNPVTALFRRHSASAERWIFQESNWFGQWL